MKCVNLVDACDASLGDLGVFDGGAGRQVWRSTYMCGGYHWISLMNSVEEHPLNHYRNQSIDRIISILIFKLF